MHNYGNIWHDQHRFKWRSIFFPSIYLFIIFTSNSPFSSVHPSHITHLYICLALPICTSISHYPYVQLSCLTTNLYIHLTLLICTVILPYPAVRPAHIIYLYIYFALLTCTLISYYSSVQLSCLINLYISHLIYLSILSLYFYI